MNFKKEIAILIQKIINIPLNEIEESIEVPPNDDMGDYAYPCFRLAKLMRKSPVAIAAEVVNSLQAIDFIKSVKAEGAYINFFLDKKIYVKLVMTDILSDKIYDKLPTNEGNTIVIDYSSPNIAKPFHVGHLRSTVIGNALYNIYKKLGYNCVGINHLGDWGTQFGKLIVAYTLWGEKEKIEKYGIQELNRLYVKFHDEAENNEQLEEDARAWFVKMQQSNDEALTLWKWFYDISMKEFNRIYERLGVSFDSYAGESFYNDKMDATVEQLKDKQLLIESNGAMIVDLEEHNMPPCLIIRTDGGTLYATRDITAAIYRKNEYNFCKCLYLTALDQNLHFAQFFKVLEKMGYSWASDLIHVPFGLVSLDTGKLSTRRGNVILMEDLLDTATDKTLQIINKKNPELENKETVAKEVGIGAVIFNDLYNNRIKDVVFSWDRMLNFDGETGPYVQYTYARASSVLRKSSIENLDINDINFDLLTDNETVNICKLLYLFPDKIIDAAEKLEPCVVTRHIVAIAQAFNKFYHENKILESEESIKKARVAVVICVRKILSDGLAMLGINTPEKM